MLHKSLLNAFTKTLAKVSFLQDALTTPKQILLRTNIFLILTKLVFNALVPMFYCIHMLHFKFKINIYIKVS